MRVLRESAGRPGDPGLLGVVIAAATLALAVPMSPGASWAQESSETSKAAPSGTSFGALIRSLDARNWVPPYFPGRVVVFDPVEEDRRLKEMMREPYGLLEVGPYTYRVSPKRAEEGKRLFFLYDFGSAEFWRSNDRYMWYATGAASAQEIRSRFGILLEPRGHFVGLVGMPAPDGRVDYGWSCALCHAGAGPDGHAVVGAPNHEYDFGLFRSVGLLEHRPHPDDVHPGSVDHDVPVERLEAMGPGRMDRNADRIENPVKIPPLWGMRAIRSGIYWNGNGSNIWFALGRHNGGVHPSSEFMEAIVAFLLLLEPPPNPRPQGEAELRGQEVFKRAGCASCHSGAYYTNGEVVPIEVIGTDPARVRLEFPKGYRVPTLRRLDLQRRYLHDGSITNLPDLLSRERLLTIRGHEYGLDLTAREKKDLVAFLLSL